MFELKPDFEEVMSRYEAWWDCAIVDRPLVSVTVPKPVGEQREPLRPEYANFRDRWMDTETIVRNSAIRLRNNVYLGDSLPVAWPNLGPEIFSAFYGCEMEYGESTAWSRSILQDWSDEAVNALRLDTGGFFFRKAMELTDALIDSARNQFIVGYTDLHGGADALAAFRDPQELLLDVIEEPVAVRRLCDRITTDFLRVYDIFHEKLSSAGMPSTTWCPVTGHGKVHIPSCDFSCMISAQAFEDLFLPAIVRECRHMDRCIYHLDGPQALRFLDRLLDIPEIHAIQWIPGAGRDHWADWIDVYQRIQYRNKAMQVRSIPAADLPELFKVLRPEGVWISSVTGVTNRQEAEWVLAQVARWTRRQ
jgi:hypothetical protein